MSDPREHPTALLVGSDSLFREGLGVLISPHFNVSSIEFDPEQVAQSIEETDPDLIIFLIGSSRADMALLGELGTTIGSRRTVVLSEQANHEMLVSALAAGVDGFLTQDINAPTFLHSLRMVMLGERTFSAQVVYELAGRTPGRETDVPVRDLTGRQRDILFCLAAGQSNKEIARHLGISEATVKVQVRSVLRRINAQNRTQAAIWAIEHDIGPKPGTAPGAPGAPGRAHRHDADRGPAGAGRVTNRLLNGPR